jgi:hypothetical protein
MRVLPTRKYGVQTVHRVDHGDGCASEVHAVVRSASIRRDTGDRRLLALLRNAACPRDRPLLETLRDAVVSDDALCRIARLGPDPSEWGAVHPRLGLYGGMCGTCASLVPMHHKYCQRWAQCLRFIQCRSRWTRLRCQTARPAPTASPSGAVCRFEAVCRRCPPIEAQLVTRTLAHPMSLPPERVRAYAAVMCDGCGAAALARLRRVERRSDAAAKIQRAFRGVVAMRRGREERRELAMERAVGDGTSQPPPTMTSSSSMAFAAAAKNPAVAATRGRCTKCEPVLESLTLRIMSFERKREKMPEAAAERFSASCCARCRAIAESRIRQHLAGARLVDPVASDEDNDDNDGEAAAGAAASGGADSPPPPPPPPSSMPPTAAVAPTQEVDPSAATPRERAVVIVDPRSAELSSAAPPTRTGTAVDTAPPPEAAAVPGVAPAPTATAKPSLSPSPSLSVAGIAKQEIVNARMERARERVAQRFRNRFPQPKNQD